ncbi:MAG: hypothetical protein EBY08_04260 [Actinobacteria bacterium]|nr:hypothetical protein [Actinomycetota bacterium]
MTSLHADAKISILSMRDTGPAPEAALARIVFGNFALAAALVAYTARISYALMMASMMFGYLLRMGLVAVAVFAIRNLDWVEFIPLGITIIVAHLGLLFWEMRYVSLSLAYPGLKPKKQSKEKSSQQSESVTK